MNEIKISISYGPLSDSIETQLNEYGCTLGKQKDFIEKLHKSLLMCQFHLLTDSQYRTCLKKLHGKVMESIKPLSDSQ